MPRLHCLSSRLLSLALTLPAGAQQCPVERLDAGDGANNDNLGYSVDIDGDTAVVGAPHDDDFGRDSGSAYIFVRVGDDWVETAKINAEPPGEFDRFGWAVGISGDTVVVGAPLVDGEWDRQGEAYVFERDAGGEGNWGQVAILTFDADFRDLNFGGALAIDADTIVVGSGFNHLTLGDTVYVYQRDAGGADNWGQVAELTAPGTDDFGRAVSISGERLAVGAFTDAGGSIFVHERDRGGPETWGLAVERTGSDTVPGDGFGESVGLDGDTLVIGATRREGAFDQTGAAYVLERNEGGADNWGEVRLLVPSDQATGRVRRFGWAVAVDGDLAVVGTFADSDAGVNAGAMYVYDRDFGGEDHWGERNKFIPADAETGDNFGWRVALDGDVAIVGARRDDVDGFSDGSAYVYHGVPDTDCNQNDVCDLDDIALGTSEDCNANGVPDECDLARGTSADCNENGIPDECDIAEGTSADCTDNGIPDECEPDCNENGIADSCDILEGTSEDCNGDGVPDECVAFADCNTNGIPDECDIAGGKSADCNENAIPDECDLANGTSVDCNADGVPDECNGAAKIVPDVQGAGGGFGRAVAVHGTTAVVGADEDQLKTGGVANVFERDEGGPDNWGETARLAGSGAGPGDEFGWSVAIRGDIAVVGAVAEDGRGAVYVFDRDVGGENRWSQVARLTAPGGASGDRFGQSVAIALNTIVIGANAADGTGAAYVFRRNILDNSWEFLRRLDADDAAEDDRFGYSVSIDGDLAAVGADRAGAFAEGAVYLFERDAGGDDQWGQIEKLTARNPGLVDQLGRSVGVSGHTVIAGAPGDDELGTLAGAIYLFERDYGGPDHWGLLARRTASDGAGGDAFGVAVAIDGDLALVGAQLHGDAGATYVLQRHFGGAGQWGEMIQLTSFDANQADSYGAVTAIDGEAIVVGAPVAGFNDEGSAYAYRAQPCLQCPTDVDQDGLTGFDDLLRVLSAWGDCPDERPCPADVDVNGLVDFDDLLAVLAAWGPCG